MGYELGCGGTAARLRSRPELSPRCSVDSTRSEDCVQCHAAAILMQLQLPALAPKPPQLPSQSTTTSRRSAAVFPYHHTCPCAARRDALEASYFPQAGLVSISAHRRLGLLLLVLRILSTPSPHLTGSTRQPLHQQTTPRRCRGSSGGRGRDRSRRGILRGPSVPATSPSWRVVCQPAGGAA